MSGSLAMLTSEVILQQIMLLRMRAATFFVSPVMSPFHWYIFCLFCSDLIDIRQTYFNVNSLKVLFRDMYSDIIFNFLKEIKKIYKLYVFYKKYTFDFDF